MDVYAKFTCKECPKNVRSIKHPCVLTTVASFDEGQPEEMPDCNWGLDMATWEWEVIDE